MKYMLSLESLREFTKKYQTTEANVLREYIQHLFLSLLYRFPGSEKILFKGGTALRIIYRSPRFSEDLDFTGQNIYRPDIIEDLFISAMDEMEKLGIEISFKEAKPTAGGYLGVIHYELYNHDSDLKFEVSLRKGRRAEKEMTNIIGDYLPDYKIWHLGPQEIVRGKIDALLSREKPRDYYDLYFFLRHPELHRFLDKKSMAAVERNLRKNRADFKNDLTALLPVSHHMILKDFKNILASEINRYI